MNAYHCVVLTQNHAIFVLGNTTQQFGAQRHTLKKYENISNQASLLVLFPDKGEWPLRVSHPQYNNEENAGPQRNVEIRYEWTHTSTDNHDTKQTYLAVEI